MSRGARIAFAHIGSVANRAKPWHARMRCSKRNFFRRTALIALVLKDDAVRPAVGLERVMHYDRRRADVPEVAEVCGLWGHQASCLVTLPKGPPAHADTPGRMPGVPKGKMPLLPPTAAKRWGSEPPKSA